MNLTSELAHNAIFLIVLSYRCVGEWGMAVVLISVGFCPIS